MRPALFHSRDSCGVCGVGMAWGAWKSSIDSQWLKNHFTRHTPEMSYFNLDKIQLIISWHFWLLGKKIPCLLSYLFSFHLNVWRVDSSHGEEKCYLFISSPDRPAILLLKISLVVFCRCRMCDAMCVASWAKESWSRSRRVAVRWLCRFLIRTRRGMTSQGSIVCWVGLSLLPEDWSC